MVPVMRGFYFSLIFTLLVASSGRAQEVPIPKPGAEPRTVARLDALTLEPEIRVKAEAFFATLKQRNVAEAYKKLLDGSALAAENPELVTKLIESTTRVLALTGSLNGTEIIRVRSAGRSLREVTYLLSGEKRPLRWRFFFYFSQGRWQILDTNIATEASAFFDEAKDEPR